MKFQRWQRPALEVGPSGLVAISLSIPPPWIHFQSGLPTYPPAAIGSNDPQGHIFSIEAL